MEEKIMTVAEVSKLMYGKVTKSTVNMIGRMCASGVIRNAEKFGRRWMINASREWPKLFGGEKCEKKR